MALLGNTKAISLTLLDGVIGNLNPKTTNVYSLGTSSLKWNNIYATTFTGSLSGNASTATKLATAREIYVNLSTTRDANSKVTFDGSADKVIHVSGTLSVARGGTGASTFTSGLVLIGNGTNAVTTRAILNNTSAGSLGWNSAGSGNADNLRLVDVNTIAYWDGSYNGTNSNITKLGTITSGSIPWSLITGAPTSMTPASHTHGNINNNGTFATVSSPPTIASGDFIVIADSSDSSKITKGPAFDGTTINKALTPKGTWEAFNNYSLPLAANGTRGGVQIGYSTSGKNYAVQLSSEKMYVNVPWTDTTYTAGTGLSLSGTQFNHSNSVTAKTAAVLTQPAVTLGWGDSFTLYEELYDAQGHITGVSSYSMTLPQNPDTDTKVTQTAVTASSYSNWRSLIWGASNSATEGFSPSTVTDQVYTTNTLSVQPSTGTIKATTFKGALSGNATTATTATKLGTTTVGSATKPIYLSSGAPTECTTYAGGTAVTLNNASKAGNTASFYAPTAGGAQNTLALVGNGTTAAPKWVNISPSSAWTAGTTAGPSLKITVLGQTQSTGAEIPSASKTASGIVTTGAQLFVGRKGFGYLDLYGYNDSGTASLYVGDIIYKTNAGVQVAETWYDMGGSSNIASGVFQWRQYSPNTTANANTTGYYETYRLPAVTAGLGENKTYNILTTKNTITVGQGGTGKTSWTQWGIVYASATTTLANTGAGSSGQLLLSNGSSAPTWVSPSSLTVGVASKLGTADLGSTTQPIYLDDGVPKAGTALKDLAYIAKPTSNLTTLFLRGDGTWQAANNYSLPLAANGTRGGVQIGYSTSGKNYAVQLSSEKMYVNVPWTDTTYTIATGDSNGQIKVTPSSGSAYNVNVKGLGSAAYVDTTKFPIVSTYTLPAGKGVRIQYPTYAPVLISAQRSNSGGRLILLGGGYGAEGTVRNDFQEVVSSATSSFTWTLPSSTNISNSIEIMNVNTSGDATVVVWSSDTATFTLIDALSNDAMNSTLVTSKNYTNYTVTKTGTGASGNWGISITGNAATASKTAAANITTTTNAVAYYTNTTGTFGSKASANGVLYATSANGALQWGTLPVAQGGTGATSAAGARTNLGLGSMATETASNYILKSTLSAAYDIMYSSAANTPTRLAANTTSTKKFLRMTGTGSAGAAPAWDTVTKSDVGLGNVENTALSTWTGSSNITTLGTISTGTWSATTIAVNKGGTGKTSWTKYGILYASDTTALANTAAGTAGYLLQGGGSSAAPSWILATNANTASTIVKRDGSGNFSAGTITATLSGNASTATKWANAQTVYVTLGTASTSTTIQGGSSSAQTIGVNGTLGVGNGGTGITSNPSMLVNLGSTTADTVFKASPRPGVTGTLGTANGGTGNTTFTASRLVYSNTATKLASTTIVSDGEYLSNVSYLTINSAHQTNYRLQVTGDAKVDGMFVTNAVRIQKVVMVPATTEAIAAGWRRVCYLNALHEYANFIINLTGGWNNGGPTLATISVHFRNNQAIMKIVHCGYAGNLCNKVRIVKHDTNANGYWLDVYCEATAGGIGGQYADIIGNVSISGIVNSAEIFDTDVSSTTVASVDLTAQYSVSTKTGTASHLSYYTDDGHRLESAAGLTTNGTNFTATGEITGSKVWNAVWNDYAEHRQTVANIELGQVVYEDGTGAQHITTRRLMTGCNITSDTFGSSMGKKDDCLTPIAVAGRVLAYINESKDTYKPGDAVCSGPNGTVSKMTRKEIRRFPDAIIGYVSEVPDYEIWHAGNELNPVDIQVNNRIWIKVN